MSAKRKSLGRGLDALIPKNDRATQQMPLDQLSPSPYQPRSIMNEAAVAELAASIAQKGVLQPLLVRPTAQGYEIVAGERRFRAAGKAGLTSVPVVVRELNDQETLEIAIIENLQREDLNPLEEARAFERLLGFGLDQNQVAEAVGKSRSAVANTLRLIGLPKDAQHALEEDKITAGHARALLALPQEERAWALHQIVSRGLSVRQAEALKRPAVEPTRQTGDGRYRALEEDLERHLATKVRMHGGRRGRIELHFRSEEELERLLELLGYQA